MPLNIRQTYIYIQVYATSANVPLKNKKLKNKKNRRDRWKIRRNWHGGVEPSATRRGEKEDS